MAGLRISDGVTYTPDRDGEEYVRSLIRREVALITFTTEHYARRSVPRKTGRTEALLRSSVESGPKKIIGVVESPSEVSRILDGGAGPHAIKPRKAKALVFYWPRVGSVVVFSSVRHPGVRGTGFLTWSLADAGARSAQVVIEPV